MRQNGPDPATGCTAVPSRAQHPSPASVDGPDFGEREFRDALSEFATGVTIIATSEPGADDAPCYAGFTANSFNSVSLAPPLVVWSLATDARTLAAFERCDRYAISVLAQDQVEIARRFARPHADRFAGVPYTLGWANAPLIDGAVAWFECRHFARQPAGDHLLFVGEVVRCARRHGPGLVFHHGRFRTTAPLPE
jgi:flavin reductase (DIM6/NTAB) family NADH-FMN oxidoreductase RutF